jgi:hypothetical protein
LIRGIAISEPSIQLKPNLDLIIKRGNGHRGHAPPLDYTTLAMYQPCATLAPAAPLAGANFPTARLRVAGPRLKTKGLLRAMDAGQAAEALALRSAGWQRNRHLPPHYAFAIRRSRSLT